MEKSETNIKPPELIGQTRRKLVVLIDSENVCSMNIHQVFEIIWALGDPIVQRIYGDFASSHNTRWKPVIEKYAIKQVQQSAYIKGKNVTDCSLIIDAMDLLFTGRYEGFCIVSSDSDFTSLAIRLREAGMMVYGFGNETAHQAYRSACYRFYVVDPIKSVPRVSVKKEAKAKVKPLTVVERSADNIAKTKKETRITAKATALVTAIEDLDKAKVFSAFEKVKAEDGWTTIDRLGEALRKEVPGFTLRKYGHKQLSGLVNARPDLFEVKEEIPEGKKQNVVFVKVLS